MAKVDTGLIARFVALYQGSTRSHGRWDADAGRASTVKSAPTDPQYQAHCEGRMGLGIVPIREGNDCLFGVIDIDTHGPNAFDTSPDVVADKIAALGLPLIACRSKSGGAHCYAFYSKPVGAAYARAQLGSWAQQLGYKTAEIFPKQDKLHAGALGNWINLPYFGGDDTDRYAIIGGKRATLEHFLETAESTRADDAKADINSGAFDFTQGPPCVERIYTEKRGEGHRNLSLFQAAIWLRRQYPDEWKLKAELFNHSAFTKPLEEAEFRKITGSVAKKEYAYKCKDEPCLSLCDKERCKTMKYGVRMGADYANLPPVESIVKIDTDPPSWHVIIFGTTVVMKTGDLMYAMNFRLRVFERTNQLVDLIKADDWSLFVQDLMLNKLVVRGAADGVGTVDGFNTAFTAIMRDALTNKQEPDDGRRRVYARDTGPAVVDSPAGPQVVFQLLHLNQRMYAQFGMRYTQQELAALLFGRDARPIRENIAGTPCNLWAIPHAPHAVAAHPPYKAEF